MKLTYRKGLVSLLCLLTPLLSMATADGPDYYRLTHHEPAVLRMDNHVDADNIITVPGQTEGLKNLGCTGMPSFAEWQKMTQTEKQVARDRAWCQVEYLQKAGWIPQKYLEEGGGPTPSFDCDKAEGQVETLICEDTDLMALDNHLQYVYQSALQRAGELGAGATESVNLLKAMQRGWIKGRNDCWKSVEGVKQCATVRYEQRIAKLQTKWMLVEAKHTERYTCGSNSNEFYLTFFNTDTLPAVALEYGDNRVVMILTPATSGSRYEGEFGRYVWLKGHAALFVWDQYQAAVNCLLDTSFKSAG